MVSNWQLYENPPHLSLNKYLGITDVKTAVLNLELNTLKICVTKAVKFWIIEFFHLISDKAPVLCRQSSGCTDPDKKDFMSKTEM